MTNGKSDGVVIRAREVKTLSGDGPAEVRRSVTCPTSGLAVPLEECAACSRAHLVSRSESGVVVACDPAPQAVERLRHQRTRDVHLTESASTPVASLLTRDVVCARRDVDVATLRGLLLEHGLSGIPVVNDDGQALGIVTKTDILQASDGVVAGDVMTPVVFWLSESSAVSRAAALMAYEHVGQVIILREDETVLGVLTAEDILLWLSRAAGYVMGE
jgi:CBS domain-containing protein